MPTECFVAAMPCAQVCDNVVTLLSFRDSGLNYTGQEHSAAAAGGPGQPSYCTLPMFHPPRNPNDPVNGLGYTSNDGHLFECRNPIVMQQAFHV